MFDEVIPGAPKNRLKAVGLAPSPLTRVIFHLLGAKFEAFEEVVPVFELMA